MDLNTLYKAALGGGSKAERELYSHLRARYLFLARQKITDRDDCEEVVQDALAAVVKSCQTLDINCSFAAWAQRVIENKIIDFYRKRHTYRSHMENPQSPSHPGASVNEDPALKLQLIECLRKVNSINRRHARILVMKYQGYGVEDICRELNLSRANAYSVLSRARSMLLRCLEEGDL